MREADVALRMRQPVQPDLIQRKLITVHNHIYAAPDYLKRHGTPQTLHDLAHHRIIIYGEEAPQSIADVNWLAYRLEAAGLPVHPVLKVNNIYGLLLAVQSGLGIATLPDYIVGDGTNLTAILTEIEGPTFDTYFAYPAELRNSKRINVFRDFLIRKIAETKF
jgi:DNA-binding transcriptional LysR family regulator